MPPEKVNDLVNRRPVDPSEPWEDIKRGASLSVDRSSGTVLARLVWDGVSYTGADPTSNTALHDLQALITRTLHKNGLTHSTRVGPIDLECGQ